MRPAFGVPHALHPLLVQTGFASLPPLHRLGARRATVRALGGLKHHAPFPVRGMWRSVAGPNLRTMVAKPTAMASYDWSRTRAFALPIDQQAWIRLNLIGRESAGIVPAALDEQTCDGLEAALRAARTQDGRPVIAELTRLAEGGTPPQDLPDMVVEWADAAHDDPLHLAGSDRPLRPEAPRLTGKHAHDGFLITVGVPAPAPAPAPAPGQIVAGQDLRALLLGLTGI